MVLRGSKVKPEQGLLEIKKEVSQVELNLSRENDELRQSNADLKVMVESLLESKSEAEPDMLNQIQTLLNRVESLENHIGNLEKKKTESEQKFEKTIKQLTCGGLAGACARTTVAPIDRVKIIMQTGFLLRNGAESGGIISTAKEILQKEGVKQFWRGNGVNCVRVFPYAATQFVSYERYKDMVQQKIGDGKFGIKERLLSGALAGATAATLTHPLDVMRVRLATQTELKGWGDCVKSILNEAGFKGFYKGYAPTVMSLGPFIAVNFSTFDYLKTNYGPDEDCRFPALRILALGGVAGLCAQTMCYPLDTIRRRMQIKGTHYTGIANAWATILSKEGVRGFYKGIGPNALKVVPNNGIRFLAYTYLTKWMGVENKYDKKVANLRKTQSKKKQVLQMA